MVICHFQGSTCVTAFYELAWTCSTPLSYSINWLPCARFQSIKSIILHINNMVEIMANQIRMMISLVVCWKMQHWLSVNSPTCDPKYEQTDTRLLLPKWRMVTSWYLWRSPLAAIWEKIFNMASCTTAHNFSFRPVLCPGWLMVDDTREESTCRVDGVDLVLLRHLQPWQ